MKKINEDKLKVSIDAVLHSNFSVSSIKTIESLPLSANYRWYSALKTLSKFEFHVWLNYVKLPLNGRESFSKDERISIEKIIESKAYDVCNFGRKRNTHRGNNNFKLKNDSYRTSYSQKGKWSVGEYYADYGLFFNRTERKIKFSLPDGSVIREIDLSKTNNVSHELDFILNGKQRNSGSTRASFIKFPFGTIKWDESERSFKCGNEDYHVNSLWIDNVRINDFKMEILRAFRRRRQLQIEKDKRNIEEQDFRHLASKVWVSFSDSLMAGNCQFGTKLFGEQYKKTEGITADCNDFAINGAYLLSVRNDEYTRRAVLQSLKNRE